MWRQALTAAGLTGELSNYCGLAIQSTQEACDLASRYSPARLDVQ
jgi:hypothetical protein